MKLLVIRFSALGDVAMTVPVIDAVARTWPQAEITVLSRPFVQPLFARMPTNVRFRGVDLAAYKGLGGLFRLYRELRKEDAYEAVADLHDVLRTRVLRFLCRLGGLRTAHIDKGRKERRALVRPEHKIRKQLPTSFQRYTDVFRRLGLPAEVHFRSIYAGGQGESNLFADVAGQPDGTDWIGFAPFAAHRGKQLPENTARSLIRLLALRAVLEISGEHRGINGREHAGGEARFFGHLLHFYTFLPEQGHPVVDLFQFVHGAITAFPGRKVKAHRVTIRFHPCLVCVTTG